MHPAGRLCKSNPLHRGVRLASIFFAAAAAASRAEVQNTRPASLKIPRCFVLITAPQDADSNRYDCSLLENSLTASEITGQYKVRESVNLIGVDVRKNRSKSFSTPAIHFDWLL